MVIKRARASIYEYPLLHCLAQCPSITLTGSWFCVSIKTERKETLKWHEVE